MRPQLRYYFHKIYQKWNRDSQRTLISLGKLHAENNSKKTNIQSLAEVEFQVFSQRGEDGIIQYLISKVEIPNKIFIEFGVENYVESNTRFLLMNNNWAGLVIDGSNDNIRFIKTDFIYWKYDLVAVNSFITKENINSIISNYTSCEDVGLLSVDIDGNDYWVWDAIEVIRPRIVVCEYNSAFGSEKMVSVPYAPDFSRTKAHHSNLYFGASLPAFCHLAEKKGYDFVGAAEPGVNAFFVRKDLSAPFKTYTAQTGFRYSANRDSKDIHGKNSFLRHNERLPVIRNMSVIDVTSGESHLIKDLYHL